MADLSPAAQAVYDAATTAAIHDNADWPVTIAAALRAAAYQVAPAKPHLESCCKRREAGVRHKLLAIAAELEGHHG